MTPAKLRLFSLLSACLLASGCSQFPALKIPDLGDSRDFGKGLDSYRADGDPKILKSLPPGEWRTRADYVLKVDKERQKNSDLLKKKTEEMEILQLEVNRLHQEIKNLETTLNKLKEVLIDTELQPK